MANACRAPCACLDAWQRASARLWLLSLAGSLVARICKDDCLLAMQKAVSLGDIVDVGGRADDGVHQSRVCIHANVRLHAKVPLVTLLGLAHLRIALAGAVLGGAGRSNQGGIHYRARLKHQAPASRQRQVHR